VSLERAPARRRASLTVESLVVLTLALFGLRVGLRPISDNSAFVHLRTGIELVRHWHIPRSDPYSFTAHGHPWVVQSWFASLIYGVAYRVGGALFGTGGQLHLVVLLQGVLMATLALLIARLARTGVAARTMASATIAVLFGAVYWSARPLIFGLIGLALLITVVERRASPWWLLPITWVWVNTHGSFPLGVAWLGAVFVGEMIDTRSLARWLWPYLGAEVGGLALAALNPLGFKLLAFPFTVETKASVFKSVVEWRSPNFQTTDGLYTLGLVALALLIIARARLPWRSTLPAVGFLALGLLSLRNIAPAAVVLAPVLGLAMRPSAAGRGERDRIEEREVSSESGPDRDRPDATTGSGPPAAGLNQVLAGALAVVALLFGVLSLQGSGLGLSGYPTKAEAWMTARGLLDPTKHRVAAQDVVGCYLVLIRGTTGRVFIDDRVDMYPVSVSDDYDSLLHAAPSAPKILDHYRVDTVLWDRSLGLKDVLLDHGGWKVVYQDTSWVVLTRTSVAIS
jgi:hypothetical protein